MFLLTERNLPININEYPILNNQELNFNFCVFDMSISDQVDYYFYPLLHVTFINSPIYVVNVKNSIFCLPKIYKILIGEPYGEKLEFVDINECMHRDFDVFMFNPLSSYKPSFAKIEIISILNEQKWFVPKIKNDHLLLSPISKRKCPDCVFLVNNVSKIDLIDVGMLV